MSTAPKKFSLSREDIPDAPEWFGKVIEAVNPFVAQTSQGLSRGLTFAENVACETKTVVFTAPEPVWRIPTLLNGWTNFGGGHQPGRYRIDITGRVYAEGLFGGGTTPSKLFDVPVGYRPEFHQLFGVEATAAHARSDVSSAGEVYANSGVGTYFSIAGHSWQAINPAMPDAPGAPWPLSISHTLPFVGGLIPLQTVSLENGTQGYSIGSPTFEWESGNNSNVLLRNVHGLTAGKQYQVKLLLITQ